MLNEIQRTTKFLFFVVQREELVATPARSSLFVDCFCSFNFFFQFVFVCVCVPAIVQYLKAARKQCFFNRQYRIYILTIRRGFLPIPYIPIPIYLPRPTSTLLLLLLLLLFYLYMCRLVLVVLVLVLRYMLLLSSQKQLIKIIILYIRSTK